MDIRGEFYASKLMDLGNYVAAGLIFGQLLAHEIVLDAMVTGFAFLVGCYVVGCILREGGENP